MTRKTRVLFLIPSLASGGAERQLSELVRHMDPRRFEIHLAVFYDPGYHNDGKFWPEIEAQPGVTLHSLHKKKGLAGFLTAFPRLLIMALRVKADVIHGYSDGNAPALLAGKLLGIKVVWGIRRTTHDRSQLSPRSERLLQWLIFCSSFVDLIIFNSEAGRLNQELMGMRPRRVQVVPNGFDVERFYVDREKGLEQRRAWGVRAGVPLIGIVGRLAPVKDHPTFLRAMARLSKAWPDARFVCIGGGPERYAGILRQQAKDLGIADKVLLPGACAYMPAAYNALDLLILSSTDEGFPNALGEAMACGIPCVATRAGDAEALLGGIGFTVNVGDHDGMANAADQLLREGTEAKALRAASARARICDTYSLQALVQRTEGELVSLLEGDSTAHQRGIVL